MSELAEALYEAFWKAGDAIATDDSVHGIDRPYMDREMDIIDTSPWGMPSQFWTHMATALRDIDTKCHCEDNQP